MQVVKHQLALLGDDGSRLTRQGQGLLDGLDTGQLIGQGGWGS